MVLSPTATVYRWATALRAAQAQDFWDVGGCSTGGGADAPGGAEQYRFHMEHPATGSATAPAQPDHQSRRAAKIFCRSAGPDSRQLDSRSVIAVRDCAYSPDSGSRSTAALFDCHAGGDPSAVEPAGSAPAATAARATGQRRC